MGKWRNWLRRNRLRICNGKTFCEFESHFPHKKIFFNNKNLLLYKKSSTFALLIKKFFDILKQLQTCRWPSGLRQQAVNLPYWLQYRGFESLSARYAGIVQWSECQTSNLNMWVRFSLPAQIIVVAQ